MNNPKRLLAERRELVEEKRGMNVINGNGSSQSTWMAKRIAEIDARIKQLDAMLPKNPRKSPAKRPWNKKPTNPDISKYLQPEE